MTELTTTVRVSLAVRDEVRRLAQDSGLTFDDQLRLMVRHERQLAMGREDAERSLTDDDRAVLALGAQTVADRASR